MHHYVYLIENLVNGKIYVGKHSTEDLDDGYMGSGLLITKAIAKYGIENFRKQILEEFETEEKALEFEKQIVNEEFVKNKNTYNLTMGGGDGWYIVNSNVEFRKEKNRRAALSMHTKTWSNSEFRKRHCDRARQTLKQLRQEGRIPQHLDWTGRRHTEETKRKIGETNSIRQTGEGNSHYGTVWIYNLELKLTRNIKCEELDTYLQRGWVKGRKMKFD